MLQKLQRLSITNSDVTIYDRGNETNRIALEDDSGYIEQEQNSDAIVNENPAFTSFENGDSLFLFNENGETIAGATVESLMILLYHSHFGCFIQRN